MRQIPNAEESATEKDRAAAFSGPVGRIAAHGRCRTELSASHDLRLQGRSCGSLKQGDPGGTAEAKLTSVGHLGGQRYVSPGR